MIATIIRVKRHVVLLGLVFALLAVGALPLFGGHRAQAAGQGQGVYRFENTQVVRFFDGGIADSSFIEVSGLATAIVDVQVSLRAIDFVGDGTQDLDLLLVGPDGGAAFILSDVGGNTATRDVFLLLEDDAAEPLPSSAALRTGRFKPTNVGTPDTIDTGAGPNTLSFGASLEVFNGSNPNGTWQLIASDDAANGVPQVTTSGIKGGWGLTITTANSAPTAAPDRFQTQAGKTLRVPAAGVLANDSDLDDGFLRAILAKKPKQGTVKLRADGSFTYTPNKDATGTDSFTYRAKDPFGAAAIATVTIRIKAAGAAADEENRTG